MPAQHCPHCHSELPERASFCGACGRRIEGWSNLPSASQSGAPAERLPGSHEATRQMEPSPSLLRVAKLQRERREAAAAANPKPRVERGGDRDPPEPEESPPSSAEPALESESAMMRSIQSSRLPLVIAMVLVAVAGGVGGFVLMRQHRRADTTAAREPEANAAPATGIASATGIAAPPTGIATPATGIAAPQPIAAAPPIAPLPATTKPARARPHTRRLAPLEVPIAQKHVKMPKGNGLPHKAVSTDSRPAQTVNSRSSAPLSDAVQDPYPTVQSAQFQAQPQPPLAPPPTAQPPPAPVAGDGDGASDDPRAQSDADSVRLVVTQHLPQVHACYSRAFKDGSPGGRLEIGFAITAAGRADGVHTVANTTDSAALARCLETRVREWQFPRPAAGNDYELIYPFVFAPGS